MQNMRFWSSIRGTSDSSEREAAANWCHGRGLESTDEPERTSVAPGKECWPGRSVCFCPVLCSLSIRRITDHPRVGLTTNYP